MEPRGFGRSLVTIGTRPSVNLLPTDVCEIYFYKSMKESEELYGSLTLICYLKHKTILAENQHFGYYIFSVCYMSYKFK